MSKKQVHFSTSEEAAYPPVLCQRIVECVKQKAIHFGAVFSSTLSEQLQQPDADAAGRMALGALPRGAKVKPLVAEFGRFIAVVHPRNKPTKWMHFFFITQRSKVTSRQLLKRGALRVVNEECHFLAVLQRWLQMKW
jgi:hypothetical protein